MDWGGDPHNKAIAVSEGDEIRLSPRKSFDRWREVVRQRSEPWTLSETESAEALRRHLVESLYRRTRGALRVAETLQRSLLPESIPTLRELAAVRATTSRPRAVDVGGDWYDAFELRDGRLIVLIGDVAGHGITAAGTMAQLRNALRAQLFAGAAPAEALNQLNDFCVHMMPGAFATVIAARVDLGSGQVEAACAGHLIPFLTNSVAGGRPGADRALAADRHSRRDVRSEHVHRRARPRAGHVLRRPGGTSRGTDRRRYRPVGRDPRPRGR